MILRIIHNARENCVLCALRQAGLWPEAPQWSLRGGVYFLTTAPLLHSPGQAQGSWEFVPQIRTSTPLSEVAIHLPSPIWESLALDSEPSLPLFNSLAVSIQLIASLQPLFRRASLPRRFSHQLYPPRHSSAQPSSTEARSTPHDSLQHAALLAPSSNGFHQEVDVCRRAAGP